MKSVLLLLALLVGISVADFAYLTYYSDSKCSNFAGTRAFTQNLQPVVGASASDCKTEMYCFFDPDSENCKAITNGIVSPNAIRTEGNRVREYEDESGEGTLYSENDCVESTIYEHCWFRYYTDATVDNFYTEESEDCQSSIASSLTVMSVLVLVVVVLL
jgi:hypothetical protein